MGFWSNLAGRILDPLGVHRIFETSKKKKFASRGFSMQSADRLHALVVAAGRGNVQAKGQLDAIKAAAASGNPAAMKLMKFMTPIAKMVQGNLGSPSSLATRRVARGRPGMPGQNVALAKAQQQIQVLRKSEAIRSAKQKTHSIMAAELRKKQAAWDVEAQGYEDKLAEIERKLAEKDWDQKAREQLEAQAAAYEDLIAKIEAKKAGEPAPAVSPTDTSPESAEGEAAMDQDAYPTGGQGGAPGDTEFTD